MQIVRNSVKPDVGLTVAIGILVALSIVTLLSIAPELFPYYFIYLVLGIVIFIVLLSLSFDALSAFKNIFYIVSLILLIITLIVGQVTRGAVRWIPIGPLTFQTSEIIRPLLLVFFANYLTESEVDGKKLFKALWLLAIPLTLILLQRSLGVSFLTVVAFVGVVMASSIKKRYLLFGFFGLLALLPLVWFILAPYQKQRVLTFLDPSRDPRGTGYNSLQSVISVGSGKLFGRGLGKGVQTQLAFLPERHTDFIFASIAEELGFVGATFVLVVLLYLLNQLTVFSANAQSPAARAFLSGLFLTLFVQTVIHIGMNMGVLPITGVTLPLVSSGGSSFLATMASLAIAMGARKQI